MSYILNILTLSMNCTFFQQKLFYSDNQTQSNVQYESHSKKDHIDYDEEKTPLVIDGKLINRSFIFTDLKNLDLDAIAKEIEREFNPPSPSVSNEKIIINPDFFKQSKLYKKRAQYRLKKYKLNK